MSSDALLKAIQRQDMPALEKAVAATHVTLMADSRPMIEAARQNRGDMVTALLPVSRPNNIAAAAGMAMERGHEALLEHIWTQRAFVYAYQRSKFDFDALKEALSHGWTTAANLLLDQQVQRQQPATDRNHLLMFAAQGGQLALVQRLCPEADQDSRDTALLAAWEDAAIARWLWPQTSHEGKVNALLGSFNHQTRHSVRLFTEFATQLSPQEPIAWQLNQVLITAVMRHYPMPLIRHLITLADPQHDQSAALRMAFEEGYRDAFDALLPVSDIKAARKHYTSTYPAQWDKVNQLALQLPLALQTEWAKKDPGHFGPLTAAMRQNETLAKAPPPLPRRSRFRS